MYGYVRPVKGELKIREYEYFRAAYCGLCEALKRRCGLLARFVVNYDLTFMAMLLSRQDGCMQKKRCPAHPLRKRFCLCGETGLNAAADYSVILAWWKLRDDVQDKPFLKGLGARMASTLLRRAYRKAAAARPDFDRNTRACLNELAALEAADCDSLDQTADTFGRILACAAEETVPDKRRILHEIFYHVGRFVYILDAADDLAEDTQKGQYNPLRFRFRPAGDKLAPEDMQELRETLNLSQHCVAAAFALLEEGMWQPILENIIYIGLPTAAEQVLTGRWRKQNRGNEEI